MDKLSFQKQLAIAALKGFTEQSGGVHVGDVVAREGVRQGHRVVGASADLLLVQRPVDVRQQTGEQVTSVWPREDTFNLRQINLASGMALIESHEEIEGP